MTDAERRKAAKAFSEYWKDKGDEKQETARFWIELLGNVWGIDNPTKVIEFEKPVIVEKNQKYIDGYISSTKVLIEQKEAQIRLGRSAVQSDGEKLTPFGQAFRYNNYLPYNEKAKWIIVSNFKEILIYNMNMPNGEPEQILLKDLAKEYYRLQFLVEEKSELLHREEQISIQAGDLVGKLYDAILKQYIDPDDKKSLHSLNILCVRLVFCLYAEDSGIFGEHLKFHNYIKRFAPCDVRRALIDLFQVLDTKIEERDPYMDEVLASFPYVNGGLFADENIEIPNFTQEIVDLLLYKASEDFDWSQISPTIFGAVFESTLNPETRRSGGMHYTSIENIHKVTDPLFLDDLREEFEEVKAVKVPKIRNDKTKAFRVKLSNLTFFDPACGSGNFLTETYISLRRLENEALRLIYKDQMIFDTGDVIKVSIGQFYGIEINDFAVTVAKTALWIAESQMMRETEDILSANLDFLPLKSYANIVEGNALRMDWESVVPKEKLDYIMGNPPFVGARLMSKEQKDDLLAVFGSKWKNVGNLDYVSCWYKKAADLMKGTHIRTALVSTNSVSQGESVAILWKPLFEDGAHIDFAHRTFRWDSEASIKAHVHCVIIGFSIAPFYKSKVIYSSERPIVANNINAYLIDAPSVFIESTKKPLCNVPDLVFGSMPNDNGFLSDYSQEEKDAIILDFPDAKIAFRRFVGATEFINNKVRWCLWLQDVSPNIIRNIPPISKAVSSVKEMREHSGREATRKLADVPMLFGEIRQPNTDYIIIPAHSSEKRKYIPIGFMSKDIICSNANLLMPNASLYHFGVLTSNIHNAWIHAVCGRIKSDFRYSVNIVYNNFPWCKPTDEQKKKIEKTAQDILNARTLYPDCSLADLYDEVSMPPELRKAHQANDRAVMNAYGFDVKTMTESSCVAELMKMYQKLSK